MSADPLSTSTRTTKRNLLAASVIAIAYAAFDVTISKIPLAGLEIAFDQRLFSFLILSVLIYFTATFMLYYYIDIRNFERTAHQQSSDKEYSLKRDNFAHTYARWQLKKLARLLKRPVVIESVSLPGALLNLEAPKFDYDRDFEGHYSNAISTLVIRQYTSKRRTESIPLYRDGAEGEFAIVERSLSGAMSRYLWWRRLYHLGLLPKRYGIRALYFIRNYLVDGVLPVTISLIAFLALFQIIDLHWIRDFAPLQVKR